MIFFKLPEDDTLYTLNGNEPENNAEFHPFSGTKILRFSGKIKSLKESGLLISDATLLSETDHKIPETEKEYLEKLTSLIETIKAENLPKVVLSRRKTISFQHLDLRQSFLNLCNAYPNAFRYLFSQNGTTWMGAFSEVLGKYNLHSGIFETMSLAGTLPVNEEWTEKEIEEQKPVTDYISNILKNYSDEISISETYSHISGNIKHLRTDFKAGISYSQLNKLIGELHPTPAVCGFPKEKCKKIIEHYEKYPREFYAGYSKIQKGDEVFYFVNLRCARIFKNTVHAFVGGGITAQSSPQKEWKETELKSQAVLNNLVII